MGETYQELRLLASALAQDAQPLSTTALGQLWNTSQQTASRRVRELTAAGLVRRELVPEGQRLSLTEKGWRSLREEHHKLQRLIAPQGSRAPRLAGIVSSGLGEGAYYVRKYADQIKDLLGFSPYEGTLNLKVDPAEAQSFLASLRKVTIPGFKTPERTYGAVFCFPLTINGKTRGAALVPERTTHPADIFEIISDSFLRKELRLKDGDRIEVAP